MPVAQGHLSSSLLLLDSFEMPVAQCHWSSSIPVEVLGASRSLLDSPLSSPLSLRFLLIEDWLHAWTWRCCNTCNGWQKKTRPMHWLHLCLLLLLCSLASGQEASVLSPPQSRPSAKTLGRGQASASNTRHMNIERLCPHCLLRTVNSKLC